MDGLDGWLSLYDGLLRAPTVLIRGGEVVADYSASQVQLIGLHAPHTG